MDGWSNYFEQIPTKVRSSHIVPPFELLILSCSLVACGSGGGSNDGNSVTPVSQSQFQDVTDATGIQFQHGYNIVMQPGFARDAQRLAGGVAAGDYDNDGDVDVFIVRGDIGPNLLYQNNGSAVFSEVAQTAGVAYTSSAASAENFRHSGPTFADIDGDADLDLFLGGMFGDPSLIFRNNGDGSFTDVSLGSGIDALTGIQNISSAFGDYDLDGDLDLFVTHWGTPRVRSNPGDTANLWRNDSTGGQIIFTSVSIEAGIAGSIIVESTHPEGDSDREYTFSPSFARINSDEYPDILVVADFNTSQVFFNNGDGTFSNVTDSNVQTDNNGMGSALGDYDNDGDLDWFVSSIFGEALIEEWTGNRLYRNDNGIFEDVTDASGVVDGGWGWGACFMDFENDGDLDLYHTNGFPAFRYETDLSRAFVLDENMTFTNNAPELGLADRHDARGIVCADFDNDGDIDILQTHRDDTIAASYYRNDAIGNNYISVRLNGLAPNTEAAGARIFATIGESTQMREIIIGSNFTSQNPTDQIFGLGVSAQVGEIRVEWPDGLSTILNAVAAGQKVTIDHPSL